MADSLADSRQAGAEIEITPAMIEAGVFEAREHTLGEPLAELVQRVFLAMTVERQSSTAASLTKSDR